MYVGGLGPASSQERPPCSGSARLVVEHAVMVRPSPAGHTRSSQLKRCATWSPTCMKGLVYWSARACDDASIDVAKLSGFVAQRNPSATHTTFGASVLFAERDLSDGDASCSNADWIVQDSQAVPTAMPAARTHLASRDTHGCAHPDASLARCRNMASDDDACEAARIAEISAHLDAMNTAATDLNDAQKALKISEQQRQTRLQLWAVGSARLARTIGIERLAKVRPYYQQRRVVACVRRRVESVSATFLRAAEACHPEAYLMSVKAEHAKHLLEFRDAQHKLGQLRSKEPLASDAAAAYFEAEEVHQAELAEVDQAVKLITRGVADAKARYEVALRNLEALSEHEHRARATSLSSLPATSPQVGPAAATTGSSSDDGRGSPARKAPRRGGPLPLL